MLISMGSPDSLRLKIRTRSELPKAPPPPAPSFEGIRWSSRRMADEQGGMRCSVPSAPIRYAISVSCVEQNVARAPLPGSTFSFGTPFLSNLLWRTQGAPNQEQLGAIGGESHWWAIIRVMLLMDNLLTGCSENDLI